MNFSDIIQIFCHKKNSFLIYVNENDDKCHYNSTFCQVEVAKRLDKPILLLTNRNRKGNDKNGTTSRVVLDMDITTMSHHNSLDTL